jgi:hypothetical protein
VGLYDVSSLVCVAASDSDWRLRQRRAKIDVLVEQLADAVDAVMAHLEVAERQMDTVTATDTAMTQKQVSPERTQFTCASYQLCTPIFSTLLSQSDGFA